MRDDGYAYGLTVTVTDSYNKYESLKAFGSVYTKAFKSSTICSIFAATGLIPFNSECILLKLKHMKTLTPLSSPGNNSSIQSSLPVHTIKST